MGQLRRWSPDTTLGGSDASRMYGSPREHQPRQRAKYAQYRYRAQAGHTTPWTPPRSAECSGVNMTQTRTVEASPWGCNTGTPGTPKPAGTQQTTGTDSCPPPTPGCTPHTTMQHDTGAAVYTTTEHMLYSPRHAVFTGSEYLRDHTGHTMHSDAIVRNNSGNITPMRPGLPHGSGYPLPADTGMHEHDDNVPGKSGMRARATSLYTGELDISVQVRGLEEKTSSGISVTTHLSCSPGPQTCNPGAPVSCPGPPSCTTVCTGGTAPYQQCTQQFTPGTPASQSCSTTYIGGTSPTQNCRPGACTGGTSPSQNCTPGGCTGGTSPSQSCQTVCI